MRLSRVVMFPFALLVGYILYEMLMNYKYEWSVYLIFPVIIIAACLSLYPQIDAYGYKFWKPKPDQKIKNIIKGSSPTFSWIKKEDEDLFIVNALTEIRKVDYIGMKVEDIPTDVEVMSIYPGLLLQYLFDIPLLKIYNRVVLYKHPFPSPNHKEWHSAEVNHEDGVLLYSIEQLVNSYLHPDRYYHIGFDVWIRALFEEKLGMKPTQALPPLSESLLDVAQAENFLGLKPIPQEVLHLYAFLKNKEDYRLMHPKEYDLWGLWL